MILPVEHAVSEDPATMAPIDVRRVLVQITVDEATDLVAGDPTATALLASTVVAALEEDES